MKRTNLMASFRAKELIAASVVGTFLCAGSAWALPTNWSVHSLDSLEAASRVLEPATKQKTKIMAEYPTVLNDGNYKDASAVHVFPMIVKNTVNVSEVNGASTFCPRLGELVGQINETTDGVWYLFTSSLEQAKQVADALKNADGFKVGNELAFAILGKKRAEQQGFRNQIKAFESIRTLQEEQIADSETMVAKLQAEHDSLVEEATSGYPDTPEMDDLIDDKEDLEDDIATYNMLIKTLEDAGQDASAIIALLNVKQAELDQVISSIDILAEDYRRQKQEEADAVAVTLASKQEKLNDLQDECDNTIDILFEIRTDLAASLGDAEYINAVGVCGQYDAMLEEYTRLNQQFREYREPIIQDAMLVINWAKADFNDLASTDAGYAQGTLRIWDEDVLEAPYTISADSGGYHQRWYNGRYVSYYQPPVVGNLGQIYNIKFNTMDGEVLSTSPMQLKARGIRDGRLADMTIGSQETATDRAGYTRIVVHTGTSNDEETIELDQTLNGDRLQSILTGLEHNPNVSFYAGLGTFCGKLDVEQKDMIEYGNLEYGRSEFQFTPHRENTFSHSAQIDYQIKAQGTPHQATCAVNVHDYSSYRRGWGKRTVSFWPFYKKVTKWDNTTIVDETNGLLTCNFVSTDDVTDADRKKELAALNAMAVSEAYAGFVKAVAKEVEVEHVSADELEEFKEMMPRHTWPPTMMALCGGNPICHLGVAVFKNSGATVNSGSTKVVVDNTVELGMTNHRSFMEILDEQMTSTIEFVIQDS